MITIREQKYFGLKFFTSLGSSLLASLLCFSATAQAQVISDGTVGTTVTPAGSTYTINNGTQVGGNLFHSFSQFSVPTGGSAYFNNALTVQTIFARVTGGTVSNIDGILKANGMANLFLMNPAGILFGANAQLNLGGSFISTTANSITFADGTEFSATNPTGAPLLTVSVPIGLQMGSNAAPITVQGGGHNGQLSDSQRLSGLTLGTKGLQVQSGKTLALVGGDLALNGGLLSAPGGRIELGSVTGGSISLNPQNFTLSYPNAASFGAIQMTQRALASTRDLTLGNGGSIQIQGKQISIADGSLVLIQNRSSLAAGDITVNATESLQITGKSPNFVTSSGLVSETVAAGAAGNILINTPQLLIEEGGYVVDRTFSAAPGGNIVVNATDIRIDGVVAGDPNVARAGSLLLASSNSTGQGGNVSISTRNLTITDGGTVGARPYATGNGGDIVVKADTILVSSAGAPRGNFLGLLTTTSFADGNAGDLTIDTRILSVQDGGRVTSSAIRRGNAGSLFINASELVEVNGKNYANNPSRISAVGLLRSTQGNAGNITIRTPVLNISNRGEVLVANPGSGDAGTLAINANLLQLDNGASISASTALGEGGNITLQLRDGLIMRRGSFISAEAGGIGNGGDITINAPVIVGFENSDIIANAVRGRGGNIQITTKGIFGLKYRPQLTPQNDITASSQFGVSGTVQVNDLGLDPTSGLVQLPTGLVDPSQKIAAGCTGNKGNSFVATGRGGLPPNPTQDVNQARPWTDTRDISKYQQSGKAVTQAANPAPSQPVILEATTWQRNPDGSMELVAATTPTSNTIATCTVGLR